MNYIYYDTPFTPFIALQLQLTCKICLPFIGDGIQASLCRYLSIDSLSMMKSCEDDIAIH